MAASSMVLGAHSASPQQSAPCREQLKMIHVTPYNLCLCCLCCTLMTTPKRLGSDLDLLTGGGRGGVGRGGVAWGQQSQPSQPRGSKNVSAKLTI